MKKRNFINLILGLLLSALLVMPVYAENPTRAAVLSDDAEVQPLDPQAMQQEQEELMENLPFAFGEFPSFSVSNVDAWSFQSWNQDGLLAGSTYGGSNGRWWHSGHHQFFGPIENIPTGALVFGMAMEACDFVNNGNVRMQFVSNAPQGGVFSHETIDTGLASTPGCTDFAIVVDPPVPIFNLLRTYRFLATFGSHDSRTHFQVVRLAWSRVISPAPASATFNDVGTGAWYFQGVEALAAANITQGCNPPTNNFFCPNANVTRAQMAVFLARALGLHWPG